MSGTEGLREITARRLVHAPDGNAVCILGQGTWAMGDNLARRSEEIASLRCGLDLGLQVIDTAEMYGNGASERLVGEAIKGRRDEVFLVTKVLPSHATRRGVAESCRASLQRLKTDYIDLYLLHWPGSTPISETIEAFMRLQDEGLIRKWGVSNFDTDDIKSMQKVVTTSTCYANQILYNPEYRGIEYDLLALNQSQKILTMAYSPLGQAGAMLRHPVLAKVAAKYETSLGPATSAQIILAWVMRMPNMVSIPKASNLQHMRSNVAALEITLDKEDLQILDKAFPPPGIKTPLAVL